MDDVVALFGVLIRFETELWSAVDSRLRQDLDLPLTRFEPMQVMARRRTCRVQDVATDLVITVGGASKLVDRIEAAGLCRRRANPGDRRSSLVELTPTGERLLAEATAVLEDELRARITDVLPQPIIGQFASILRRLRAAGHAIDSQSSINSRLSSQ
ncbi:MarR family winged helix-turn-helix transcriptional regulator [Mycobacteroides abscessus]